MKKTLVVIEDHTLIRELWVKIYNEKEDVEVVGDSGDFDEAMEMVKKFQPDLVSLDINLNEASGFDAVPLIQQYSANTRIIVVSMHIQLNYLKQMLEMGVMGYVTKSSSHIELFKAIDEVSEGRIYVCTEMQKFFQDDL
ncbi:MAG: response regulator transcription factor [Bacteroidota bacterium]|jgi:two-component system invasion response regulator UvrY